MPKKEIFHIELEFGEIIFGHKWLPQDIESRIQPARSSAPLIGYWFGVAARYLVVECLITVHVVERGLSSDGGLSEIEM